MIWSAVALAAMAAASAGWAMDRGAGEPERLKPLDCPSREGDLVRTAVAPDGLACTYAGPDGQQVRLTRLALHGRTAVEAVEPLKAQLRSQSSVRVQPVAPLERSASGDHADIDLPFFHVHAHGDRAEVRAFGTKVHADGQNAEVHTSLGLKNTVVHAGPQGAEIVAESVGRRRAELVYVLAPETAGARREPVVGYIAKGPSRGPLAVAEFRVSQHQHGADTHVSMEHGDLGRLVDRNAG